MRVGKPWRGEEAVDGVSRTGRADGTNAKSRNTKAIQDMVFSFKTRAPGQGGYTPKMLANRAFVRSPEKLVVRDC
jgi:hypothetical protein